mgnify:FL=1
MFFSLLIENIINHTVLLFFLCASYAVGRLLFRQFLFATGFGLSALSLVIYNIFLIFGINLFTVSSIYVSMLLFIFFSLVYGTGFLNVQKEGIVSALTFKNLSTPAFLIPGFSLIIYLVVCAFPLADGDSIAHYCYLPKLYISGGNFSVGNTILHGSEPILYQSLITFLAFFGTIEVASIFNFYLVLLLILNLYEMCLTMNHTQNKINFNTFCLIIGIFVANPLMYLMIQSGRPYILIAYFSTSLLCFLLQIFDKKIPNIYDVLFLGFIGGALVSVSYLGIAALGCLFIAFLAVNYDIFKKNVRFIFIGGLVVMICAMPLYLRTYFITGDLIHSSDTLTVNEFKGFLAPIKALFILSTRTNQGGVSCSIGILYFSFFPVLLYFVFKRRLWKCRIPRFILGFIILYYFIWLSKIPMARLLLGIFPPYLLLLYLFVNVGKPLYKYPIYLFCGLMVMYSLAQFARFDYCDYLFNKQTKADFVYNKLYKWSNDDKSFGEQNEIVNYINSNFKNHDVVFYDGMFSLTLLSNKVFKIGMEKQLQRDNALLLSPNSIQQTFKPLKRFKSYTIYAYQ